MYMITGQQELPQQVLSATSTLVTAFCGSVEPACLYTLEIFLGYNAVKHR